MSKELKNRLEKLEIKKGSEDPLIIRMWCPFGKAPPNNGGRTRIVPLNPEDAE